MWLLTIQFKNTCSSQDHFAQVQTPGQAFNNQTRMPKFPLPKSELNVVGDIWGNVKKRFGFKHEFLPAPPRDIQFLLVRPESDWYFDKRSKAWRLPYVSAVCSSPFFSD